jgi:HSP20 family molecular chaperone IbpA
MRNSSLMFPRFFFEPEFAEEEVLSSRSHVEETDHGYFIQIDAPGIKKEDVKISLENQNLVVEGERKGKFAAWLKKRFLLPDDVNAEGIQAQMNDGVLEIALPKKEMAKPKTITVQEAKENFFHKFLGNSEGK